MDGDIILCSRGSVSILVITRNQCELELYHIGQVCRNMLEENSDDIRTLEKSFYNFSPFFRKHVTNITIPLSSIISLSTFYTVTSSRPSSLYSKSDYIHIIYTMMKHILTYTKMIVLSTQKQVIPPNQMETAHQI